MPPPTSHPLDRVAAFLSTLKIPGPGNRLLARHRHRLADEIVRRVEGRIGSIAAGLRSGDPEARSTLQEIAGEGLAALRAQIRDGGVQHDRLALLSAGADSAWLDPDGLEHIDNPDLDAAARTRAMEDLDGINAAFRLYDHFVSALNPLLRRDGPTRILDLASGHGGFAIALARHARAAGLQLRVTATDVMEEYLRLGEAHARRQGLDVEFAVQNALDLSNVEVGDYDVIVCTQSIHHFPAGMVAVMFSEAARVCGRGVLFVDGCRSILAAIPLVTFAWLRFRNPILVHDALVSFRRFFVPEELALLARFTPWRDQTSAWWAPPGHCALRYERPA